MLGIAACASLNITGIEIGCQCSIAGSYFLSKWWVNSMKSYSEMIQIPTFEERIKYLKTNSSIGIETFSFERWINQNFYLSKEWQNVRNRIIVRDLGHDVAMPGIEYLINGIAVVHHINPLTKEQLVNGDTDAMFNPQNLVVVSKDTHNMIHFGHNLRNKYQVEERCPNDTIPWRCENGY